MRYPAEAVLLDFVSKILSLYQGYDVHVVGEHPPEIFPSSPATRSSVVRGGGGTDVVAQKDHKNFTCFIGGRNRDMDPMRPKLILVDLISGGGEDLTGSDNTTAEGVLSLLTSTVMDCVLDKSPGFFAPDSVIVFLLDGRGRKDRGATAMIGQIFDHKYVQRHEKAVAAKLADVSPGDSAFLVLSKIRDFWTKEAVPLKIFRYGDPFRPPSLFPLFETKGNYLRGGISPYILYMDGDRFNNIQNRTQMFQNLTGFDFFMFEAVARSLGFNPFFRNDKMNWYTSMSFGQVWFGQLGDLITDKIDIVLSNSLSTSRITESKNLWL